MRKFKKESPIIKSDESKKVVNQGWSSYAVSNSSAGGAKSAINSNL